MWVISPKIKSTFLFDTYHQAISRSIIHIPSSGRKNFFFKKIPNGKRGSIEDIIKGSEPALKI
jgi:hypothetical protein